MRRSARALVMAMVLWGCSESPNRPDAGVSDGGPGPTDGGVAADGGALADGGAGDGGAADGGAISPTISGGYSHTCATRADRTARCWGANLNAQIGDGTTDDRLTPTAVTGLADVVAVAAGGYHSC